MAVVLCCIASMWESFEVKSRANYTVAAIQSYCP